MVITDVFILVSVVLMFGEFVFVVTGRSVVGVMLAVHILSVSLTCVVLTVTVHNYLVLPAQCVLYLIKQKHTFSNQTKCTTMQNKHKN